jgi:cytochrome b subunit of formate dehydrogenase
VDYWAVMLGMQSMGITGLLMWFPEYFSTILPGYFVNVANHFHFHEAILAVMYIGVVHMSDTHLLPEVFPLEKSIFNGKITKEKLAAEHPEEWKRINPLKD